MHVEVAEIRVPGVRAMSTAVEIETLYRARYPDFLRVATAIVGDEADAADSVHDAFVSALRAASGFRGRVSLEAWVWKIVVNAARKQRRRSQRSRSPHGVETASPPTDTTTALDALLRGLTDRQRTVVFLRHYADLDYRGIGTVLGIAPGTVAATLHAAHVVIRDRGSRDA